MIKTLRYILISYALFYLLIAIKYHYSLSLLSSEFFYLSLNNPTFFNSLELKPIYYWSILSIYGIVWGASIFFLYTFKNIGRYFFLIALILDLLLEYPNKVLILDAIDMYLFYFDYMFKGAIIVLIYFSPLKNSFKQWKMN